MTLTSQTTDIPASRVLWSQFGANDAGRELTTAVAQCSNGGAFDYTVSKAPLYVGEYDTVLTGIDAHGEPVYARTPHLPAGAELAHGEASHDARRHAPAAAEQWEMIVRDDTGDHFGPQGSGYEVVQNLTLARLADSATGDAASVVSAFNSRGGRECAIGFDLGTYRVAGDDTIQGYGFLRWSHDGTVTIQWDEGNIRPFCANVAPAFALAGAANGSAFRLRHTRNVLSEDNTRRLVEAIGRGRQNLEREAITAQRLAARVMNDSEVREFFQGAYDSLIGFPTALTAESTEKEAASFERAKNRAVGVVSQWYETIQTERESLLEPAPTAWLALNAVTKWNDHVRGGDSNRLRRNLFGAGVEQKRTVQKLALALV